jgi:hypothetical protein
VLSPLAARSPGDPQQEGRWRSSAGESVARIREILEAYDLTGSYRAAAELAGVTTTPWRGM